MIPALFQDISVILEDTVFKTRQILQRVPQGPLKLLNLMHTSTNKRSRGRDQMPTQTRT
jgi:hypothetical protein